MKTLTEIREDQAAEIGKTEWTLRSLVETLKSITLQHVSAEMARNHQLAIEHLEDAQHRLERVTYEYDKLS